MRLILVVLIFFTGTVLSKHREERRFDRSVYDDFETSNVHHRLIKKQWTFTDDATRFRAYKDREENNCYIEKLEENAVTEELSEYSNQERKYMPKVLYAPTEALTKFEAWQIAGGRIVDFCNGRKIVLLQNTMLIPGLELDPFFNTLPLDENDIVARRVADVVLTPLISRAKRQLVLEERQRLNENFRQNRFRRQVQLPGKFQGQTQSQYLNINDKDQTEGKAEAEAFPHSSRAAVSGSHGMGQAQSTSLGIGCEDCSKYTSEGTPDRYIQHPGASPGRISLPKTTSGTTGTLTGGTNVHPGMITPGMGTTYPGKITPGITKPTGEVLYPGRIPGSTTGGHMAYPSNIPGTTTIGGGIIYPSSVPDTTITNGRVVYPGIVMTGGEIRYPGTPTTGSRTTYPGNVGGTTTGGGTVYPGGGVGPPAGGTVPYPGGIPGGTTGGVVYPGGGVGPPAGETVPYPAGVPGGTTGGVVYPGRGVGPPAGGTVPYSAGVPGGATGGVVYPGGGFAPPAGGTVPYPAGVPGGATGGVVYPGGGVGPPAGETLPYPAGVPSGTTGGVVYPGGGVGPPAERTVPYPAGVPGGTTGGVVYPGGGVVPPAGGTVPYPGGATGTTTGGDGTIYPGDVAGRQTGGTVPYPGGVPGGTIYPGGVPGGTIYPGGVTGTATGGGTVYPGGVSGPTTSGGTVYPGGVTGPTTGGGTVYPGGVAGPTTGGTYPGGTTGGAVYPGGVVGPPATGTIPYPGSGGIVPYPGGVVGPRTGTIVPYPGGATGVTTGSSAVYPGAVVGPIPGGGTVYPGAVVGPITGGGTVYPGAVVGPITGGGTVYPGAVVGPITGGGTVYPGAVVGPTTGGGTVYPDGVAGPTTGGTYPGGVPGGTTDGSAAYPRGSLTPERLTQTTKATADSTIYPNGQIPRTQYYGGDIYSTNRGSNLRGDIYHNISPSGTLSDTFAGGDATTDTRGVYPGGTSPGGQLRETAHYPGEVVPGAVANRGTIPGIPDTVPSSGVTYPGGTIPSMGGHFTTGDHTRYPGSAFPEITRQNIAPGTIKTDVTSGAGSILSYPDGTRVIQYPDGSMVPFPDTGKYPNNRGVSPPGYPLQQGQYPGIAPWHDRGIPTSGLPTDPLSGGVNRQGLEQYPTDGQGTRQQYPNLQYLPNVRQTNTGEPAQYQEPGSFLLGEGDNSNSQASSSVKQMDSGTQASASAQGKFGQGTSQSQVTGTYSGSGSFSAQAGSTDNNKSAQTEISGGKEGAASNAQGMGGYGKSQAQVQLNSESGATTTGAQSSGLNHGTNSQVQASSKGGMADAQANGEGSTSSQAQIGFQPYLKTDEKIEKYSKPFRGGGTASAQSGAYTGQSQSQLEGSFQYGITYTGAAQAGSGSGASTSRKPFNFNITDTELFKPFKPSYIPQIAQKKNNETANTSSDTDYEYNQDKLQQGLQTSSSSRKTVTTKPTDENSSNTANKLNPPVEKSQTDDTLYDYEEEYDGEDYDASPMQTSMNTKVSKIYADEQDSSNHQSQTIHVTTGNQYDLHVKQNTNPAQVGDMLHPGQSLSGYTIPPGFRGRVTSVAGSETSAHGDGKSQSQTVSLVPKEPNMTHESKSPISEIRSLKTNHERLMEGHVSSKERQKNYFPQIQSQQFSTEHSTPTSNILMKPSYYTVTNSVAGKMEGRNSPRKYEHRYYTKSSTCGYFTFSCNIVYGSNGRTKICKPKVPTYPDGTPMKC
ncbi:PREDICTED: mucin-19-like [Habropoda laboriosa]|uniref:mucin-19-like n=1 Tax=Habropoda laboriosa TaxID=597456 RepID=UPI00083DDCBD|nr:PREDICTED: mucin-19-like [Habropoda laboriosa]